MATSIKQTSRGRTVRRTDKRRKISPSPRAFPPSRGRVRILPGDVHSTLAKHMLVDGFDFVVDLKRSKGSYVHDARTNRRYLDFFTFFGSGSVGINHPKMTAPAFLEKLAYVAVNKPSNSDAYTVEMAEFVDAFGRLAQPAYLPHAFFVDGGALAVENALKTAFDWKVRKNFQRGYQTERGSQIVHFRRAFHGRSGYTLALTNTDPVKTNYFPKFSWPRILNPAIRFPMTGENLERVKREEAAAIAEIKNALVQNKDDIAALIIEPIQCEGGDNQFRAEFLKELRVLCDENEMLYIMDEVQTGVGITGKMWCHEYYVKPDLMTFGKKTQVCGFLSSTRIDDVAENVFHTSSRINSTFGGNLIDMVRFAKILEIIEEDNLVENARIVGGHLLKSLGELEQDFPRLVDNTRGRGLLCAMDLPTSRERDELKKRALERGLILIGCGERSIRFRPPLTLSPQEVDEGVSIIRSALQTMKSGNG